jgi:hypothetical protein
MSDFEISDYAFVGDIHHVRQTSSLSFYYFLKNDHVANPYRRRRGHAT